MKDKLPDFANMCKIIKKYYTEDTMKIRLIGINDLDRINTKLIRRNEELELENRKALEYKNRIAQETESMEKQMEIVRKRITNQW